MYATDDVALPDTAQGTDAEQTIPRVRRILSEVFPGRDDADGSRTLRELGLDSLSAARLVVELQIEFGVEIPMARLGDCRGAGELAVWVGEGGMGSRRPDLSPDPSARFEAFPLTAVQQAYLIGRHPDLSPDPVGCHIYREFVLDDVDVDRLRTGWQRVVERHDALRLVVTADQRQRVLAEAPPWTMPVHSEPTESVRARLSHHRYEAGEWPPFAIEVSRPQSGKPVVHLSIDAMVTDGHGLDVILDHWWRAYSDPAAPLPSVAFDLRDCLQALAGQVGGQAYREDLDYWRRRLVDLPSGPDILADQAPAPLRRRPLSATFDAEQWTALRERAAEAGASPTAFILTVFADTLARHGTAEPFSLVLTTNQRSRLPAEVDTVVGPFTSTCVFVVDADLERGLDDAARSVSERLWADLDHGVVSGVEALRELRTRGVTLPVVFTSLLDGTRSAPANGFTDSVSYALSQTSGVALDAQLWEFGGELCLRWDVSDSVAEGVAEVLFCDFVNALAAACLKTQDVYRPLNELQKAYYVAAASGDESWTGCQVYHSFDVVDLDLDRLSGAWVRMLAEYEALRSHVTSDGRLGVRDAVPDAWLVPVVGHADPDELVSRAFRLGRWPRFDLRVTRSDAGRSRVHLTIDLIVCDGRSVHFLMRELFRRYADPDARPRPAKSFDAFADRSAALQRSSQYPEWKAYWRERLTDLPPGPGLPMEAAVGGERVRTRRVAQIDGWPVIREQATRAGVSLDAVLVAALTEALAQVFAEPFALPVVRWAEWARAYRPGEYTALSWIAHSPGGSSWDRAAAYQRHIDADEAADAVGGLAELRRVVMKQRRTGRFGYPVVYTGLLELADQPLPEGVTSGPWLTCTPDVSMDCIAMDSGADGLRIFWDVVEADFAAGAVDRVFEHYVSLLRGLAGGAEDLAASGMTKAERHRVLVEWNETDRPFAADGPVHLMFEEQAELRPDAIALRWRGGRMTYRELNRRANAIAWRLRDLGVGAGSIVGICAGRGPDMVAAVYGILKAGGAYLPIEPHLPAERALGILEEAGAAVLLTTEGALTWTPPSEVTVVCLDASVSDVAPLPVNDVDDPAYVIYTSGSTGKPKGVLVTHRPLHNLFAWCRRMFGFDDSDVGLCVTSLGFDLSVFDLLGLLGCGAGLYIADEAQQKDPAMLLEVLVGEPITFWNSAPTTLNQLAPSFPATGSPGTRDLRLVFLSGDYTPLPLPAQLRAAFPKARLISLGGATEATVWSNYFPVETVDPEWRTIPYGRPIDNSRYYILDDRFEPCPPGEPGDLFIAGSCLSQGYVNRPDLTEQRFIPDPHSPDPGGLMYRTGDRASYFQDGTICFLGRLDDQVKIRGFRVELGEIEHRLLQHPSVADVVVAARPDETGDRKLIAYVIPATQPPPSIKELRQHAAVTLPDYMVPNFVAFLDVFPATSNGKLDRDALPWPLRPSGELPAAELPVAERSDAAVTQMIEELAVLFAELVGTEAIDVAEDLWDQGATSFTMVQASAALQKRHGRRIAVSTLLAEPTVEGIARAIATELGVDAPDREPAPAAEAPEEVDFFDPADRAAFKDAHWNLRRGGDAPVVALPEARIADQFYRWRGTRRDFTEEPVPLTYLSHLLSLLRPLHDEDRDRYLYPSAGDTYAVQVYVRAFADRIDGLPSGVYYYRPAEHDLRLVNANPVADRSAHFYYNREIYDRSAFELYLVGQNHGIEPLYGEDSARYLAIEAGHLAQLLMTGQAVTGLGLCPIGATADDVIGTDLDFDDGHRLMLSFLGGRAAQMPEAVTGEVAPYASAPSTRLGSGRAEVAVIGMSGRYPGADDIDELWRNLRAGKRSVAPLDPRRVAALGIDDRLSGVTGGFLTDIEPFDSMLFRITPAEAATLDPQLRLLLEAAWRCMEDAGYTAEALRGLGRVGVFVGTMWPDFQLTGADEWRAGRPATGSGISADLPNRVSHVFGFTGPSVAVDTSCSSSLTALHLAVQSINNGECSAALVAGVNLIAHPYHLALLSGLELVAPAGAGGAFDADASGWSPAEGVGVLLLRPREQAAEDRDLIHGVIEGTWTGHAGTTSRFGAPNSRSLADSLNRALSEAKLTPADIDYVECAAAGAAIADAAELEALGTVFAGRQTPVGFGTVKPNLGHLEAASGMSQLAKVLLQIRHRHLAPTLIAPRINPLASWDPDVLRLIDKPEPWPSSAEGAGAAPARVLINALGATGSYAHVIVSAPGEGDL